MYRSVTESKSPREGRRRAIHRLEGVAVVTAHGARPLFSWGFEPMTGH